MIAKAGLGLIGLSAISVGGVALANPAWLGMPDPMPEWHPLTEDSGFSGGSTAYTDGKFGKKYGKYLVGVSKAETEGWWKWAHRRLNNESTKPDKFKSVNKGYDSNTTDETALNTVCKKAYETVIASGFATGDEAGKFKKTDVWKYCSPGSLTHTGEDNPLYPSGKIGADETNKTILVSVKDSSNDWFWDIRNKDFWTQEDSNDWSGKKATGTNGSASIFKTEYESKKGNDNQTSRKTIKDLCEEAYGKNKGSEGADKSNDDDAKKFCVLEATGS